MADSLSSCPLCCLPPCPLCGGALAPEMGVIHRCAVCGVLATVSGDYAEAMSRPDLKGPDDDKAERALRGERVNGAQEDHCPACGEAALYWWDEEKTWACRACSWRERRAR